MMYADGFLRVVDIMDDGRFMMVVLDRWVVVEDDGRFAIDDNFFPAGLFLVGGGVLPTLLALFLEELVSLSMARARLALAL